MKADALTRYRATLREAIKVLESWQVDDPLSPFVGDTVVSRDEVLTVITVAFKDSAKVKRTRPPQGMQG